MPDFLQDRLTQLVSRYVGIGLIWVSAHIGATLKPEDSLTTLIVTAAGAGVAFLIDHVSHYFQHKDA